MNFKTIDATLLTNVNGGASKLSQARNRINSEVSASGGSVDRLRMSCGPNKSGTVLCNGTYNKFLGAGGGFEHEKFNAVFEQGQLKHLQNTPNGGD